MSKTFIHDPPLNSVSTFRLWANGKFPSIRRNGTPASTSDPAKRSSVLVQKEKTILFNLNVSVRLMQGIVGPRTFYLPHSGSAIDFLRSPTWLGVIALVQEHRLPSLHYSLTSDEAALNLHTKGIGNRRN